MIKLLKDQWNNWKRAFWRGKLPIIYFMLIDVALVFALTIYHHTAIQFYAYFIASIATYGVFTDEVAHLFPLYNSNEISFKEWIKKVFSGRTHDVYGMVITMIAVAVSSLGIIQIIIIAISLIQVSAFAVTRFYH
jgi:uncharacterized membrane protein YesL